MDKDIILKEKNFLWQEYALTQNKDLLPKVIELESQLVLFYIEQKDYKNASVNLISKGSCYAILGQNIKAIKAYEAAMILNHSTQKWCKLEISKLKAKYNDSYRSQKDS